MSYSSKVENVISRGEGGGPNKSGGVRKFWGKR